MAWLFQEGTTRRATEKKESQDRRIVSGSSQRDIQDLQPISLMDMGEDNDVRNPGDPGATERQIDLLVEAYGMC
jgi:hypothetical protein